MHRAVILLFLALVLIAAQSNAQDDGWKKHIVHEGVQTMTAVAGDFSGDGLPDVIADSGNQTRLFVAPDWQEVVIDVHADVQTYIHSECFDVDGDGDLDYIGARYNPGLIVWLEQPENAVGDR